MDAITPKEAEESVLGALLMDSSAFTEVDGILEPEHFSGAGRAAIYRHVREQSRKREMADVVTVSCAMPEESDYAFAMIQQTAGTAMLVPWAQLVREKWVLRQAAMIGSNLAASCRGNDADSIDEAVKALMALRKASGAHQFTTRNAVEEAYAHIREASERPSRS